MAKEIECFGAKGDMLFKKDGTMTPSSPVLNSADGEFRVTDVGKTIVVNGAGPGGIPLKTTIVSRQSATQVTLGVAASPAVSSLPAIYYYGTDDKGAFQSAINQTAAAGGGRILLGLKNYLISDKLVLPSRDFPQVQVAVLEFVGAVAPMRSTWGNVLQDVGGGNDMELAVSGQTVVQLANVTDGAKIMDVDWITPLSGAPSAVQVFFNNIIFRVPTQANVNGLDLQHAYSCRLIDVNIEPSDHQSNLGPPFLGGFPHNTGLRLPRIGNGAQVICRRVGVIGFNVGIRHSEHADLDDIWLFRDRYPIVVETGSHACRYARITFTACPHGILAADGDATVGPAFIKADLLNYEDTQTIALPTPHWAAPLTHIHDPNNNLRGTVTYHKVVGFVGVEDGITVFGGNRLIRRQVNRRLYDGGNPGVGVLPFNCALTAPVSTTSIPVEENTKQEWMLREGVIAGVVDANGAYFPVGDGHCLARLEATVENYSVSVDVDIDNLSTRTDAGLCLKYIQGGVTFTGGTFIASVIQRLPGPINRLRLFSRNNGVIGVDLFSTAVVFNPNNTYRLRLDYNAGTINVFVDGVLRIGPVVLSGADVTLYGKSRQFGLYSYVGPSNDDRTTQWRNFSAVAI